MDSSGADAARSDVWWWAFAVALAVVVVTALDAYLGWLVFGLFLYYVARPINRRLEPRVRSSTLSAGLTMLVIVLPFVAVLVVLAVAAFGQLSAIGPADAERLVRALAPEFDVTTLPTDPLELYRRGTALLADPSVQSLLGWAQGFVGTFAAQAYNAFLALIFVFFLVRDEDRLAGWIRSNVLDGRPVATEYFEAVDRGLDSVYFGYTLTIVAIVLISAVLYNALNLIAPPGMAIPQTVLLAVVTGLATVVPLIGRSIVYVVVVGYLALIALRTDLARLWFPASFYVLMGIGFDNVVRTYVRPVLSGRLFHNGLIMFAYLLGPPIFGWYGIFLGPLIMVVVVQFLEHVFPQLVDSDRRSTAAPTATDDGAVEEGKPPVETANGPIEGPDERSERPDRGFDGSEDRPT